MWPCAKLLVLQSDIVGCKTIKEFDVGCIHVPSSLRPIFEKMNLNFSMSLRSIIVVDDDGIFCKHGTFDNMG